ncbi:unnamed protein product [Closterium sp. NIES-54]
MHEVSNLITDGDGGAKVVAGRKAPTVIAQTERRDRKVVAAVKALASQPSQRGFVADGMSWCHCVSFTFVVPLACSYTGACPPHFPTLPPFSFPRHLPRLPHPVAPPSPPFPPPNSPSGAACARRTTRPSTIPRPPSFPQPTPSPHPFPPFPLYQPCATIYRKKVMMNVTGGVAPGNLLAVMGGVWDAGGENWEHWLQDHLNPPSFPFPLHLPSAAFPYASSPFPHRPEGSGKSLLLHMLAGRLEGDPNFRGSIEFSGEPFGATLRREIGFVENDVDLQANLTVRIHRLGD